MIKIIEGISIPLRPKTLKANTAAAPPKTAGSRLRRSRHWSVKITRNSAVIAKSMPLVAAAARSAESEVVATTPATAPAVTPHIQ